MKLTSCVCGLVALLSSISANADSDAITYLSHEPASIFDTGLLNIRLTLLESRLMVGATPIQMGVNFDPETNMIHITGLLISDEKYTWSDGAVCKSIIGMIRQSLGINTSTLRPVSDYQIMAYFTGDHTFSNSNIPSDLEQRIEKSIALSATYYRDNLKTRTNCKSGLLDSEIYVSGPDKVKPEKN